MDFVLHGAQRRLHADEYKGNGVFLAKQLQQHIKQLKSHIAKLLEQALKLIEDDEKLSVWYQQLNTIPGVAAISAVKIIAELLAMPLDMKPKHG